MFAREIEKFVETADSGRKKRPKPADIQKIPLFLKDNAPIPAQTTLGAKEKPRQQDACPADGAACFRDLSSVKDVHNIGKTAVVILLDGG